VPGKDHFHMVDMTIGAEHQFGKQRADDRQMDNKKFGKFLVDKMHQGLGSARRAKSHPS
jgi:hypothetical protein